MNFFFVKKLIFLDELDWPSKYLVCFISEFLVNGISKFFVVKVATRVKAG
jgi:hypothetical protein